jgi:hypothetical protein
MDGNGLIQEGAIASGLTGMETDSTTDSWEGILLSKNPPCPIPIFLYDLLNKRDDIIPHRTRSIARRSLIEIIGTLSPPGPCFVPIHESQRDGNLWHFRSTLESKLFAHRFPSIPNGVLWSP